MEAQLDHLPVELLLHVSAHLEYDQISCLVQTCRRFQALFSAQLANWRLYIYVSSKANAPCSELTVDQLLSQGARINWQDPQGKTCLHAAASAGNEATVNLLLAKGASVAVQDHDGRTAMFDGMRNLAVARLLLENGADANGKACRQQTALHLASEYGRGDMTELLLEHGAEVDSPDICGQTALHWAAYYGQKSCCRLLLAKGANVLLKDNYNLSALEYARMMGGHKTLIPLLEGGIPV